MFEPTLIYKIRGIIFDVYNQIVGVWDEQTYENILFDALRASDLSVVRQKVFEVYYKSKRVGLFRPDLIAEDKVIIELKAVPEIFSLHQAQVISYLKVTGLPLGMLVNFGGEKLFMRVYPNKMKHKNGFSHKYKNNCNKNKCGRPDGSSWERLLSIDFDVDKVNLPDEDKRLIYPYLMISKEILEILGPGYFHHVYRRAFWEELKMNKIDFEWINQLVLNYEGKIYGQKDVKFFKIENLLISALAVKELDNLALKKFAGLIKYYGCSKGLILNFNNTVVDFRLIKKVQE